MTRNNTCVVCTSTVLRSTLYGTLTNADNLTFVCQVAARNCRKRKIDQIKQLEDDVTRIRCRKMELVSEHEKLQAQRRQWNDVVKGMHDYILKVRTTRPMQVVVLRTYYKCPFLFNIRSLATTPASGSFRWTTTARCTSSRGAQGDSRAEGAREEGPRPGRQTPR